MNISFRFAVLGAALLFVLTEQPRAVSAGLVISQVYGAGGNSGATYTHDYVELYNRSGSPISLSGLSIQYASATGTGNFGSTATQLTELPDIMLPAGKYYLIQESGGATGSPLPTADLVDNTAIAMAAGAGKVALVSGIAPLGCNGGSTVCNAAQLSRIVDLVGYGGANFYEGSAPTGTLSATIAAIRKSGNVDTDDNSADFEVGAPKPRNSSTTPPPPAIEKPIYELQGEEETSAFNNMDVSTTGVVTARKTNGFFIQVPDLQSDGNALTSDALFVFTGSVPTIAVRDEVRVVGRLVEFRSATASKPGTLTEITNPTVTRLTENNPLPAALDLAALLANPTSFASATDQFERYEGMLASTPSMDVVAPSNTFGELYAVISTTPRPFREAGIDVSEQLPAEAPPSVDRFDGNFERVMRDSDDFMIAPGPPPLRRPRLDLPAGTPATPVRVLNVFGPLDYAFDSYRVMLDPSAASSGGRSPQPVPARAGSEFTIASLNLENYRDGTPNFENREQKAARLIIEVLDTPDILGLIEVGDLEDLQVLAAAINAAAETDYQAYLLDGNNKVETFEQNIGYLVNNARVEAIDSYQVYQGKVFEFGGEEDLLHDRPPFVLEARVRHSGTPVTVILNHLKSLIDVNSHALYGSTGLTTGARNRLKRRLQAEDLADLVSSRINENLVVLGDMNAFEFNDGLADVIGTIEGSPAPADEVTEPSIDRWAHELTNLAGLLPPQDRYSYVFEGNAQVLDHMLVNDAMLARLSQFTYARNNADFPESFESDFAVATRLSDHDAAVGYFQAITDLAVTTSTAPVIAAGGTWVAQVDVSNSLDTATDVTLSVALPSHVIWQTTLAPAGWTCATASGVVTCTADILAAGAAASFEIAGSVGCAISDAAVLFVSAAVGSQTDETDTGDNAASSTAAVTNPVPTISGAAPSVSEIKFRPHQLVPVTINYVAGDACGPVTTSLSVTSSETTNAQGEGVAGHTSPDWVVVNEHEVMLRAEHLPASSGRVYTITITAVDAAGQTTTEDVTVTVPR